MVYKVYKLFRMLMWILTVATELTLSTRMVKIYLGYTLINFSRIIKCSKILAHASYMTCISFWNYEMSGFLSYELIELFQMINKKYKSEFELFD